MKDEQKKILDGVINVHVRDVTSAVNRIAESNYSLMNLMRKQKLVIPGVLWQNLLSKLEIDLNEAIEKWRLDSEHDRIIQVLDEYQRWDIHPRSSFGFKISRALEHLVETELKDLEGLVELLDRLEKLAIEIDLILLQNHVFQRLKQSLNGDWTRLGEKIQINVEAVKA